MKEEQLRLPLSTNDQFTHSLYLNIMREARSCGSKPQFDHSDKQYQMNFWTCSQMAGWTEVGWEEFIL